MSYDLELFLNIFFQFEALFTMNQWLACHINMTITYARTQVFDARSDPDLCRDPTDISEPKYNV